MYETFEHTADLGLRVRAAQLNTLFEEAAAALFSLIVTNLDAVRPTRQLSFQIAGNRLDDLLRDWLAELLYTFHTGRLLLAQFAVSVNDRGLVATASGEPIDPARHHLDQEVKAVTYHGLKVTRDGPQWLAEVIVDI
jgi:SHS2 domain-containing protein